MNYNDIHTLHRDKIIKDNLSFLNNKVFLEFGVYYGSSLLIWHELYKQNSLSVDLFGFDSFQGLPDEADDKKTIWQKGDYSTNGVITPELLNKSNIHLVSGFYDQSLNEDAAKLLNNRKAGIIHIDCDTYSSTKTVWEWLLKHDLLTTGTLVLYDDWGAYLEAKCGEYDMGEAKAHKEIEAKYNIQFTDLGKYILNPAFYEVKIYRYDNLR